MTIAKYTVARHVEMQVEIHCSCFAKHCKSFAPWLPRGSERCKQGEQQIEPRRAMDRASFFLIISIRWKVPQRGIITLLKRKMKRCKKGCLQSHHSSFPTIEGWKLLEKKGKGGFG